MAGESLEEIYLEADEKMDKAVQVLAGELAGVRTGRANPAILEGIKVPYYGTETPLKQVANIGAPEPQLLVIRPWEAKLTAEIEKAILASSLGLTPQNDGKLVRIPIPPLSEERRRQLVKHVNERAEAARVAIRNVRRDANKEIDAIKKGGAAPEDDCFKMKDDVQELTEEKEKTIAELLDRKTKELMEV